MESVTDALIHGAPATDAAPAAPNAPFKFKVTREINIEDVSSLLCSALEGGSSYWYEIAEFIEPPTLDYRTDPQTVSRHLDYPLSTGGALIIDDVEGDKEYSGKRLDRESIARGLQVMAEKEPQHFADLLAENADATTGDVFLQCCLFGEVIFG